MDDSSKTHDEDPSVRSRRLFAKYKDSSSRVFDGRNHCFNDFFSEPKCHGPLNTYKPKELVQDIRQHLGRFL
jgi:hypothetical protein